mmetsp:Transcript_15078/g.48971  ORF Transcript_15078/g.48971 Transcript_15078/m.48971 type:complete len:201 (-) Transcript_15078:417-1019(-)
MASSSSSSLAAADDDSDDGASAPTWRLSAAISDWSLRSCSCIFNTSAAGTRPSRGVVGGARGFGAAFARSPVPPLAAGLPPFFAAGLPRVARFSGSAGLAADRVADRVPPELWPLAFFAPTHSSRRRKVPLSSSLKRSSKKARSCTAATWTWCVSTLLKSTAFEKTRRTSAANSSRVLYMLRPSFDSMVPRSMGLATIVG